MENDKKKTKLTVNINGVEIEIPRELREHYDAVVKLNLKDIKPMKDTIITRDDIKKQLKRLKEGKAPGPDGIKPEIYKTFLDSDISINALQQSYKKIIDSGEKNKNWNKSKTTLTPKIKKPTAKDLRPIALTNISYKIFMGIIREKIEEHLENNGITNELQAGFTKNRRITDNLFILRYCIENSFKNKKELYVIAIDFKKAFDSVDRGKLIETMMKYKIDSKIVDIIASIYTGDSTDLYMNNEMQTEIEITSGIRQGCNGSTVLFLLITYVIIEKIQEENIGYKDEAFNIAALFFADDGLVLTQSINEAKRAIKILKEIGETCGLDINSQKSNIMIYNKKEIQQNKIEDIEIVEEIKYLGVKITNKRNCFDEYKKDTIEKAKKFANMMYSTIATACNRVLIGKTFWKNIMMPTFLHGTEVIDYTEAELQTLQRIDNQVYRTILGMPSYTASSALRSEIGASSTKSRDMKSKIMFVKHIIEDEGNNLVKEIFMKQYHEGTKYMKKIKTYMKTMNVNLNAIEEMSKQKIKEKINQIDTDNWKAEMGEKETLKIYREYKEKISEIKWYDNTLETKLIIKARTDTLELNWRNKHKGKDVKCICNYEEETLEHFLLDCEIYSEIRKKYNFMQQPYIENRKELLANILIFQVDIKSEIEIRKSYILNIWRTRKSKQQENENQ